MNTYSKYYPPTKESWRDMWRRCTDPRREKYARYGGRGIMVVSRWESYDNFVEDMGIKPEGMSLGRIDNDGPYCKENCRWETMSQQLDNKGTYKNNTSGLKGVSFDNTFKKWAAYTKGGNGVKRRIYYGLDFFEACCARKSWENKNVGN